MTCESRKITQPVADFDGSNVNVVSVVKGSEVIVIKVLHGLSQVESFM